MFILHIFVFVHLRFHSALFLSAYSFGSVFTVDHCELKAKNGAKHIRYHANTNQCERGFEAVVFIFKVVDHKPKILEIIKKNKHKRSSKKKTLPSY